MGLEGSPAAPTRSSYQPYEYGPLILALAHMPLGGVMKYGPSFVYGIYWVHYVTVPDSVGSRFHTKGAWFGLYKIFECSVGLCGIVPRNPDSNQKLTALRETS